MTLWSQDLVALLIESSIRVTIIAAFVWVVLAVLRVRAGALCHTAWTMVVVAMLVLPIVPKWLPALPMDLPQPMPAARAAERPVLPPATNPRTTAGTLVMNPTVPLSTPNGPGFRIVSPRREPAFALSWPVAGAVVWGAGALVMLLQLVIGWRRAARLTASSRNLGGVLESDLVAAPVVVGVISPRIIVPVSWHDWPDDAKHAVLVHERAHLRRRDLVVSLLARLARCVYWFHPLAWWLERRLMSAAEQACDDEVIRASVEPRCYAELLVDMAGSVRARGGRVAWQGLGMAGGGSLGARVDRVLSGVASGLVNPARRLMVWVLCAAIVIPGVACRQRVPPLREDPEIAARLTEQKEHNQRYEQAKAMTLDEVAALEAVVARNPDDLDSTSALLYFYRESGAKLMGWNAMVAARRPHLLRLVERHPESDRVWWPLPQRLDPEGWAQARALWMKHLERPDVTPKTLSAAARFFAISEKPMAEQILLRAEASDPGGPRPRVVGNVYYSPWRARLGELYARAIVGSDDDTLFNVVRSASLDEANGPFAKAARSKLDQATDPVLLRAAGTYLTQNAGGRDGRVGDQGIQLGFDHRALGESYIDRSIALDPDSETTKRFVAYRERAKASEEHYIRLIDKLGPSWSSATVEQVSALSESDRLDVLMDLGSDAYMRAESVENSTGGRAKFRELLQRAKTFSEQALALAGKFTADPRHAKTVYEAHMILGVVALREGDRRLALTHLEAGAEGLSGAMPVGEGASMWPRLTNYLLKDGERESVAEFFEKVSKMAGPNQKEFADAAQAIRDGRMPRSYQYAMTPR